MKNIKRWVLAVLAWQLVTLWKKDTTFRQWITKANSPLDKLKAAFDWLFSFNKELVSNVQDANYDELKTKAVSWFEDERTSLEEKLHEWEEKVHTRSADKLPEYVDMLEKHLAIYEEKALRWKDKVADEVHLDEIVTTLKTRVTAAKDKMTEITKNVS